ncbi:ABC transporter G family member 20-like protein [Dinothrombium tinctorium]|uniref:ABC transporter G family member 20-like protein n=1 Tax=Dinothrombium tinctorium TaxID=1965070 RepID=A0A3S3PHE5_9ACAR|nr:ABC transporter G family member 20-like protein [Dinothrombium tinctorium]
MAHYNLTTLEDVFLKLCTITKCCSMSLEWQQEQHQLSGDICFRTSLPPMKNNERIALVDIIKKKRVSFNFWQWSIVVSTMARKNMTRYIRHPLILWFQYLLPISQIVLLCICVGGDPFDVRVGIVNDENPVNLSSIFIKSLDFFYIDLRNYSDMQTAIADIKQTKLWGVIHIPANFTQCLGMRVQFDREFENDVINCSTIKIRADQTNKLITLTMERSLEHSYQSFLQAALSEFDLNPRIAQVPIALGETIHGVYGARLHRGFRDHMACGFLTSFTFAVSFALTAIILVLERCDNMFERHFVVGVSTTQLILAHFVSRFLFLIIQVVLSLLVTVYAFELDTRGSLIYAIVSLSLIGFSGLAFGIVLSAICRSIKTLTMLGASFMFFVIFVSGCFWPLEAMPYWFRWFSLTQPTTLPTECLRTILSRGAGISDHRVSSGILVSLAWFALLFFLGYKFFRYN